MSESGGAHDRETTPVVFIVGHNAESLGLQDHPSADSDGHLLSASVLMMTRSKGDLSPVRVLVGHGVAPETASAMLRKMADLVERAPEILNQDAGATVRALPDGTVSRVQLDLESILTTLDQMPPEIRGRVEQSIRELGFALGEIPTRDEDEEA
ncbi:MAG: hypothetical protein AAGI17_03315 [Planctomycetota bacterium]